VKGDIARWAVHLGPPFEDREDRGDWGVSDNTTRKSDGKGSPL